MSRRERAAFFARYFIEPCTPPIPFNTLHTLDLSRWHGQLDAPPFLAILDSVAAVLNRPSLAEFARARAAADAQAYRAAARAWPFDPLGREAETVADAMTRGDIVPDRFVATRSPWPSRRTLGAAASTTIRTVRPWGLALALAVVAAGMGALWQMQGSSERAAAIKAVRPDSFESLRSRLGGAVTASDIRLFLNATPSAPDRAAAIARL